MGKNFCYHLNVFFFFAVKEKGSGLKCEALNQIQLCFEEIVLFTIAFDDAIILQTKTVFITNQLLVMSV